MKTKKNICNASLIASTFSFNFALILFSFASTSFALSSHSPGIQTNDLSISKSAASPYDGQPDESVYFDYATRTFAVFSGNGEKEVPLRFGKFEITDGQPRIVSSRDISTSADFYTIKDPSEPMFLVVCERLPAGGFGRLLKYRGRLEDGTPVDLEFLYNDREGKLTVLDYNKGKFYRTTFAQDRVDPYSFNPLLNQDINRDKLMAIAASSVKFTFPRGFSAAPKSPKGLRIHSLFDRISDEKNWLTQLVRGPPAGELAL